MFEKYVPSLHHILEPYTVQSPYVGETPYYTTEGLAVCTTTDISLHDLVKGGLNGEIRGKLSSLSLWQVSQCGAGLARRPAQTGTGEVSRRQRSEGPCAVLF